MLFWNLTGINNEWIENKVKKSSYKFKEVV